MFSAVTGAFILLLKTGGSPNLRRSQAFRPVSLLVFILYHHQTLYGCPNINLFGNGRTVAASIFFKEPFESFTPFSFFTFTIGPRYSFSPGGKKRFTLQLPAMNTTINQLYIFNLLMRLLWFFGCLVFFMKEF